MILFFKEDESEQVSSRLGGKKDLNNQQTIKMLFTPFNCKFANYLLTLT